MKVMLTPDAFMASAIGRSARPSARSLCIRLIAFCPSGSGTSAPSSPTRETERHRAAEVPAALLLVAFHFGDALAGPVPLGLGHGGQDGEHQLGHAVAGGVAAEVDHVQVDAGLLQLGQHVERIEGGAEHAVELGRDDDVAGPQNGQQRGALLAIRERLAARDAALDVHVVDRQPLHLRVAGDLPLLHVEAFALVGLPHGRDAAIAVDAAGRGRWRGDGEGGTFALGRWREVLGEARLGSSWHRGHPCNCVTVFTRFAHLRKHIYKMGQRQPPQPRASRDGSTILACTARISGTGKGRGLCLGNGDCLDLPTARNRRGLWSSAPILAGHTKAW